MVRIIYQVIHGFDMSANKPLQLLKQLCAVTAGSLVVSGVLIYHDLREFLFLTGMAPALFGVHITISLQNKDNPYQLTWLRLLKLVANPQKELTIADQLRSEQEESSKGSRA